MAFSFIHVSDIHLGRPFSDLGFSLEDIKIRELYKKAAEKAFYNFIEFARAKNVDFVLISGDTFDSDEQDFESKLILLEGLKRLANADIKVFLICGNHDPLNSYNKLTFNFDGNENIKIVGLNTKLKDKFIVNDKRNNPAVVIHALSFKDNTFNENPAEYFECPDENEQKLFNIGLLHCDLDGNKQSPYAPCLRSELKAKGYDYWALGHIHIPDVSDDTIAYAGTIQGRNIKESGAHGIKYVKSENGVITKISFVPVDVIRFESVDTDLSGIEDLPLAVSLIQENIENFINQEINSNCELFFLRLNLTGCVSFYNEINDKFFEVISERVKSSCFGRVCIADIVNNTTAKADACALEEDEGIAGALYKVVNNSQALEDAYRKTHEQMKHLLIKCNFDAEETAVFSQEVKNSARETCINLCSRIYNDESKEDSK